MSPFVRGLFYCHLNSRRKWASYMSHTGIIAKYGRGEGGRFRSCVEAFVQKLVCSARSVPMCLPARNF
jgi:hypothetical protein